MMRKKIAVLPGDGIGPEVTTQAVKVLKTVGERFNHTFIFEEALIGAKAIDETGSALPNATLEVCKKSDAVLLGAIGDPRFDNNPTLKVRPEQGLLELRKKLGLFANIRPVNTYKALHRIVPLKPEILVGVDFVVFRELTGGIYFGEKKRSNDRLTASDVCTYHRDEITRIAHLAFKAANNRKKRVTLVDKANVLETSRLWRETVMEISKLYPEITLENLYVDNAAMQLILNPGRFDVILTENMFGDILTDEASVLSGSLGLLPSASIGNEHALYEPVHGSYPQAAGKNIANPIGSILSAAMMLEYSFGLELESTFIQKAVKDSIENGFSAIDLNKADPVSTSEIGDYIAEQIETEVINEM